MAEELSVDSLQGMKKAEFIKAFKNKAAWKKAKSVIIFVDYKLDGKKTTVAIPFKKEAEMKAEMKRIKKEKIHLLKKTGAGYINFESSADDGLKAIIELKLGALKPELLQTKGTELFGRINALLEVVMAADAEIENEGDLENEEEELEEENADTNDDATEDNADAEMSEEEKKAAAKTIIQELARLQMDLKGEWTKFKGLVTEKSNALVLIPAYGSLQQSLNAFADKIEELTDLGVATEQAAIFHKNYEQLKTQLNTPNLEKLQAATVKVKQNTLDMVADINAFIQQIGFDSKHIIHI